MTIHLLDELTINQMAAGEVIENTASVIKELVENALDAHSTSIEIEIETGGRSSIRVSDNGEGIAHDEVPKAILRHATSKLRSFSDLEGLRTLGFRGEALASIASVSKLSITTAPCSPAGPTPNGTFFVAEGGKTVTHVRVFREKGTSIEVKDLFFNAPVRKSFQRSTVFDTQDIVKALTHIALGFPEVHFKLVGDKKVILDLLPSDLKERATRLLGKPFVNKASWIEQSNDTLQLCGLIGDPLDHRHNRMGQYLLLNRRSIVAPHFSAAVREGYGHALPEGRYPQFVLHLTLDPKEIDVNVHPRKTEARFKTKGTLAHCLTSAVQKSLYRQCAPKETFSKMAWSAKEEVPLLEPQHCAAPALFTSVVRILETMPGYVLVDPKSAPKLFDALEPGIGIVDTAAACGFLFKKNDLPEYAGVNLLIPFEMEATVAMLAAFEEVAPVLKNLGISATPFSQRSILIHSYPTGITECEVIDLVREVFEKWQEDLPLKRLERASHFFGKKRLNCQEALYLVQKLEGYPPQPGVTCLMTAELLNKWMKK